MIPAWVIHDVLVPALAVITTLVGWYGYGRSVVMLFNVPITEPFIEYLVVWATLRIAARMDMPG